MSTLKDWRNAQNPKISQVALAAMLDTTQSHVSDIERNEASVGLELAAKVFSVTGIRIGKMKDMTDQVAHEIARVSIPCS